MQVQTTPRRLEDFYQWRYDHELTEEEIKTEERFNREMSLATYRENPDAKYSDVYWLLTEWRSNAALLLEAAKRRDTVNYDILLSHRSMLNYYLNVYLWKNYNKGGRPTQSLQRKL